MYKYFICDFIQLNILKLTLELNYRAIDSLLPKDRNTVFYR